MCMNFFLFRLLLFYKEKIDKWKMEYKLYNL